MPYTPALDGLRAFAIVLVIMFHARAPAGLGGYIGVDIFFVLSGYLITRLLLEELDASGRIDLPGFYRRRMLRLTPALFAMLGVYLLAAPFAWPAITDHGFQAALAAAYLSDYGVALWGLPQLLSHTWSLSVEAHFYLIWPLVVIAAYRRWDRRSLVVVFATVYVVATLVRWVCVIKGQSWNQVYYRFDTHLSGLVLGAWFAAAQRHEWTRRALQRALPWLMWMPVFAIICLQYRWDDLWMPIWGFGVVEWATVAVLLAIQRPHGQVSAMLSQPPVVWIGKISYGLYLWHFPIFRYLREGHTWEGVLLIGLPLSITLAFISHYSVEAWAARRRGRSPAYAMAHIS